MARALGAAVYPGHQPELGRASLLLNTAGRRSPLRHMGETQTPVLHWHGNTSNLPENLKHAPNRVPLVGYQRDQTWKRSFPSMPFLLISDEPLDRQLADVKEGAVGLLMNRFVIAELMEAVQLQYQHQAPMHDTAIKIALSA